ncbi:MAG: prolipoprotein diacylglyceryl transferase [Candidatus Gastranaerophilales bacterium]|nr:prolipoprotein diacylglyceryl transferase [Candidatus Gastranaerophilales bacterium]
MELIITPPISPIFISFNHFAIRWYGLIMGFSFIIGIIFAYFLFKYKLNKYNANLFLDYSPLVIFCAIVGARLFYVLALFEYYFKNPIEIIMINHGGLSIFGAIFFGILSIYLLSKIKKFNFLKHLDVIAVIFPLCQAVGRFGNYFNQEAYGAPTNGFLKLFVSKEFRKPQFLDIEYYHPTFLYESILDLLIFIALLILFKGKTKNGTIACCYLILYSIVRFIVEGIRIDSVLNIQNVPIVKIICIFTFIFSLTGMIFLTKKRTT